MPTTSTSNYQRQRTLTLCSPGFKIFWKTNPFSQPKQDFRFLPVFQLLVSGDSTCVDSRHHSSVLFLTQLILGKHMYRQLLRVFAHMYQAHFQDMLNLRIEPHINSLFAHYLAFGAEFDVLDKKELKGSPSNPTGIGYLYDKWRDMGRLD